MRLLKWLFIVYFFLAGVTWVQDGDNVGQTVLGRVTLADALMALIAPIAVLATARIHVPKPAWTGLAVVVAFMPGMLAKPPNPGQLLELLVHFYLIFGFVILCTYLHALSYEKRIEMMAWWVRTGGLLAAMGLWDFLAGVVGLPQISTALAWYAAPGANSGGVTGTFRNTGQAGAFFSIALACAISLQYSVKQRKWETLILTILILFTLLLTVKRAAIIAAAAGVFLLALRDGFRGMAKIVGIVSVVAIIVIPVASWLLENSSTFSWRFDKKVNRLSEEQVQEGFLGEIVTRSVESFLENPVFGSGLGGTRLHEKFEVHSTYFKILAESGLVGVVCYTIFMVTVWRSCLVPSNGEPRSRKLARALAPLLIGLMLSWGYTYHFRKREFWIMVALFASVMVPVPRAHAVPPGGRFPEWEPEHDTLLFDPSGRLVGIAAPEENQWTQPD